MVKRVLLLLGVLALSACMKQSPYEPKLESGDLCGNGTVDEGELCDGDNCPTECNDGNACTTDQLTGSAETCDARCSRAPVSTCKGGDGCCPVGCNNATDSDCSASCGDGVLDVLETCDLDCPLRCDDGVACSRDILTGDTSTCRVACSMEPETNCLNGDGCCPRGCTRDDDTDCSDTCGDGVTDSLETCDGNCPTECDDGNACTVDRLVGNAETCSADCSHVVVTECRDDDGCCAAGCDSTTDNDCSTTCGDGTVDAPLETCEGADCLFFCDDGGICALGQRTGSPATCSAACAYPLIKVCRGGDGCCPPGCDVGLDSDCAIECQNGVQELGELCDQDDIPVTCFGAGFTEGDMACKADCTLDTSGCTRCGDSAIEGNEACDSGNIPVGKDCASEGFTEGTLACNNADCTFDTSLCTTCGDRSVDGDEECDDPDDMSCGTDCRTLTFSGAMAPCAASPASLLVHGLVVASVGETVTGRLEAAPEVSGFVPTDQVSTLGRLIIDATGAVRFYGASPAGALVGIEVVVGGNNVPVCLDVVVVDTGSYAVATGSTFDAPLDWSGAKVPGPSDLAYLPAGTTMTLSSPVTVGSLVVGTGASLVVTDGTTQPNLTMVDTLMVGGEVVGEVGTQDTIVSGRVGALACNGNLTVNATAKLGALLQVGGCGLVVGNRRLTVTGDLTLSSASFVQSDDTSVVEVQGTFTGNFTASTLSSGRLRLGGNATHNGSPLGPHVTELVSDGAQTITGSLMASELEARGAGLLELNGINANNAIIARKVNVVSGTGTIPLIVIEDGGSSDTPTLWSVQNCTDNTTAGGACADFGL